jgi:hypothetical protein
MKMRWAYCLMLPLLQAERFAADDVAAGVGFCA